jgi:hypothetical protein
MDISSGTIFLNDGMKRRPCRKTCTLGSARSAFALCRLIKRGRERIHVDVDSFKSVWRQGTHL